MTKIPNSIQSNKISIDSFKLRIPFSLVNVLDENLMGTWQYVNDKTGEINPYFNKKNSVSIREKGKKTRYAIESFNFFQQAGKNQLVNTYLTILINSKVLENKYFEGITLDNISYVYNSLMAQKVVKFTIDDFIKQSYITDVDFKKDCKIKDFASSLNELRSISKESKQKDKGYRYFNNKDNKGIEWSTRKTKSFKGNPYLKLYHKEIELKNKSFDFSNEYLKGQNYIDTVRIETTVKNNAHFKYLGLSENSLYNILNLTDEQKEGIIQSALSKHLEPRIKNITADKEMKPMEKIIYGYINLTLDSDISFERGKNLVLNLIENKTERSRKRKLLDEIYTKHIQGSKNDLKAIEKDKFWTFVNW